MELQDRKQRKDFMILRGMTHMHVNGIQSEFKESSSFLIKKEVTLSDSVYLDQDEQLYRGKIMNSQQESTSSRDSHTKGLPLVRCICTGIELFSGVRNLVKGAPPTGFVGRH